MAVFLKIALAALAIIAISLIIIAVYRRVSARLTAESILKYGRASEKLIYSLLSTVYPKQRLFKNITLPVNPEKSGGPRTEVDLIAVGRGGVCVIEVKGHKGFIENPNKGDWCQLYGDKILPFPSPFEQNAAHLRAVERIFKAEHVYNVPLLNLVVFTDRDVKFKNRHDNLYKADNLLPALHNVNRSRFMSGREIKAAAASLSKYARRSGILKKGPARTGSKSKPKRL